MHKFIFVYVHIMCVCGVCVCVCIMCHVTYLRRYLSEKQNVFFHHMIYHTHTHIHTHTLTHTTTTIFLGSSYYKKCQHLKFTFHNMCPHTPICVSSY